MCDLKSKSLAMQDCLDWSRRTARQDKADRCRASDLASLHRRCHRSRSSRYWQTQSIGWWNSCVIKWSNEGGEINSPQLTSFFRVYLLYLKYHHLAIWRLDFRFECVHVSMTRIKLTIIFIKNQMIKTKKKERL